MRYALALLFALTACAAEPVLLPDASTPDAGPCGGACGAGTVCVGGACVVVDAGAPDAVAADSGAVIDVGEDRPAVDAGALDAVTVDAGGMDVASDALDAGGAVDVQWPALPDGSYAWDVAACERCRVAHGECTCTNGRAVYTCVAEYAECDGDFRTGCEAHITEDRANCGRCGSACVSVLVCRNGRCQ